VTVFSRPWPRIFVSISPSQTAENVCFNLFLALFGKANRSSQARKAKV